MWRAEQPTCGAVHCQEGWHPVQSSMENRWSSRRGARGGGGCRCVLFILVRVNEDEYDLHIGPIWCWEKCLYFVTHCIRSVFALSEPYAVMPPMEVFMEVSYEERRSMIYRDLERGDIVVGRINNIREYGFFLTLFCTAGGLKRDIEDLELSVGQQIQFSSFWMLLSYVINHHCRSWKFGTVG